MKGAHVQQIVNVHAELFQIAREQRRAVDIAVDDVVCGIWARLKFCLVTRRETLLKSAPTIRSGYSSSTLPRAVRSLNHVIDVLEESAVAASHVADAAGLEFDRPIEDFDDDVVDLWRSSSLCAPPPPQTFIARLTRSSTPFSSVRGMRGLPNSSVLTTENIGR